MELLSNVLSDPLLVPAHNLSIFEFMLSKPQFAEVSRSLIDF